MWRWKHFERLLELLTKAPREAVNYAEAFGVKGMIKDVVDEQASIGYPPVIVVGQDQVDLNDLLDRLEAAAA